MRTIEEIKADIAYEKQRRIDFIQNARGTYRLTGFTEREYSLRIELLEAITIDIPIDQLQEICDAKRLIGKTIYKLTSDSPKGYEETVIKSVKLTKNTLKLYAKSIYDDWGNARWEIKLSDIGKTIFLTKEEAEKTLNNQTQLNNLSQNI